MGELARERPNVPIWFELSVKVVADKAAANEALLHMQHCYHADPKCFFTRDDEADVASRVLDLQSLRGPTSFRRAPDAIVVREAAKTDHSAKATMALFDVEGYEAPL